MSKNSLSQHTVHEPILVTPTVESLVDGALAWSQANPGKIGWIVDCTVGGGGHTEAILNECKRRGLTQIRVLSADQDEAAIERVSKRLAPHIKSGALRLVHTPISALSPSLEGLFVVGVLADLGFSSDQLEDPARGLSFLREGPLDMRMDRSRNESAAKLLARVREQELADLIFELGEDRHSRRIARKIIEARARGELPSTTTGLATLISSVVPVWERKGRIHPATRTFQALRIWVNSELEELDSLLSDVILKVTLGGRVAILSFHSLEDRKVKLKFKESGMWKALSKKPIEPSEQEVQSNPRARSAKLRVAERI